MSIPETEWARALEHLRTAGSVTLSCHIGPDGDALGSMLALGLALRQRGVEAAASFDADPFDVPRQYAFLPGQDLLVPPSAVSREPELMVTFDAGSLDRLGVVAEPARAARTLVVVDHHVSNDHFGHVNLIDAEAAASAVIVHEMIGRMGVGLDQEIATCLYTGLVTDTGRFQYRNTTPAIHELAAELLAAGVEHDMVTQTIYNTHPLGFLKLAATALERIQLHETGAMVWTWVTQRDLDEHGVKMEDTEPLIDLVRTADVTDVAAVLKEQPDGRYKVSMRSKGASNVGAVCESFGGGGHALAAGFTAANGDPRQTVEQIVAALRG